MDTYELPEHYYEKTLVAAAAVANERLVIWLDGTNTELSFHKEHLGNKRYIPNAGFRIAGGPIGTNAGVSFTKEQLLEIAGKMKEGATLKIAACNHLNLSQVERDFAKDNNMVKCGPHAFKPSTSNDFKELDEVELISSYSVAAPAGTQGTIVHKYPENGVYEVELFDSKHTTLGVFTLTNKEMRKRGNPNG